MATKKFKASLVEKICVHALTGPGILATALTNSLVFVLDGGRNFAYNNISDNWKDKVSGYEALVGTFENGNPEHDRIKRDMDEYWCGYLSIGTAKLFRRI